MSARPPPRPLRIALVGFGNVGRRLAELLPGAFGRVLRAEGALPSVTAIYTARHGAAIDPGGLPLSRALRVVRGGGSLDTLHRGTPVRSALDLVRRAPADALVELSPLAPASGEPAVTLIRAALERGLHAVTANKGPVAFAGARLARRAARRGVLFLHEGAILDGTPLFNLAARCLPGVRVLGFRGVLNATTTRVLARMEAGATFEAALREARRAGVAEADPRLDVEGWDAAVKACVLANALMGADARPDEVERRGISRITPASIRGARRRGARLRLVARARRVGGALRIRVRPEEVPAGDVLAADGADGVLVLETDLMGELGLWEGAGGVDQTAYAILADLVEVVRASRRKRRGSSWPR